jgi:hypothetical protein
VVGFSKKFFDFSKVKHPPTKTKTTTTKHPRPPLQKVKTFSLFFYAFSIDLFIIL